MNNYQKPTRKETQINTDERQTLLWHDYETWGGITKI